MGELTDDSISDNDSDGGEISDRKEVDRFGFTGGDQYTESRYESVFILFYSIYFLAF